MDNVARLTILAMFSKLANLIISNVASYWFKNWSDFKSTYRIYNLPLSQEHINASLSWSILYIQTFQGGKLEGGGDGDDDNVNIKKLKSWHWKGIWSSGCWNEPCYGLLSLDKAAVRECLPNMNGSDRGVNVQWDKTRCDWARQSFTLRGKKPVKPLKAIVHLQMYIIQIICLTGLGSNAFQFQSIQDAHWNSNSYYVQCFSIEEHFE